MSGDDLSAEHNKNAIWEHLDYYVRRFEGELVLVHTLLKQMPGQDRHNAEIATFYYRVDELDEEWAQALMEQGKHLEEGKSTDFAPPNELYLLFDDAEEAGEAEEDNY